MFALTLIYEGRGRDFEGARLSERSLYVCLLEPCGNPDGIGNALFAAGTQRENSVCVCVRVRARVVLAAMNAGQNPEHGTTLSKGLIV